MFPLRTMVPPKLLRKLTKINVNNTFVGAKKGPQKQIEEREPANPRTGVCRNPNARRRYCIAKR